MKETPSISAASDIEPPAHPSYEHISARLTELLESAGGSVIEDFPHFAPRGAMAAHDHASRTLVLHPWIAPRARADALLRETVDRLIAQAAKPTRKRAKTAPAPRDWVVREELARRYGLAHEEVRRRGVDVTGAERALIDRIAGAIEEPERPEGQGEAPHP